MAAKRLSRSMFPRMGDAARALGLVAALASCAGLSACTTEQWYNEAMSAAEEDCRRQAQNDRAACVERTRESYDAYEKKRRQASGS